MLTHSERNTLLRLSRQVLTLHILWGKTSPNDLLRGIDLPPALREKRGVFVTLRNNDILRGCIGYIEPIKPLYEAVILNTINAATRDERFEPVEPAELENLTIDLSVISPLSPIQTPDEIRLGVDGVMMEKENTRSLFLPQVAVEQDWNVGQLLTQLSLKAGLPKDAWKKGAKFFTFTTESFSEKDL
jgi:AmmeMemoRadiSam system protein A